MTEDARAEGVSNREWPECIQCGSEETTVIPLTGEWRCEDCGRQWHTDETQADDGDADKIPGDIEGMLRALADHSGGGRNGL